MWSGRTGWCKRGGAAGAGETRLEVRMWKPRTNANLDSPGGCPDEAKTEDGRRNLLNVIGSLITICSWPLPSELAGRRRRRAECRASWSTGSAGRTQPKALLQCWRPEIRPISCSRQGHRACVRRSSASGCVPATSSTSGSGSMAAA